MVNANNVCTYIEEATIDLLKKKKLKTLVCTGDLMNGVL